MSPSQRAPGHVQIFDTTLRDGEQSAGVNFSKKDKLDIAHALAAMRVDVIEAGFPAASPSEFEAVRAVAAAERSSTICGLSRCADVDIEAAAACLAEASHPRIHLFIGTSHEHLTGQLRKSTKDVLALVDHSVRLARKRVAEVEFSPMDATRADLDYLCEVVRTAVAAGASVINIPDTVGIALPHQVGARIRSLFERVPELHDVIVSFHGQDDLGMSSANAIAAVQAGARQVELAVNGIGERAGNTSFEEVVMALRVHGPELGVFHNVDTTGIWKLSQLVTERSGIAVPRNKALVGDNAFKHASGVHQDGVLKARATFEAIDPAWIGHPVGTEIVLGKLSGRAGFVARLRALQIGLEGAPLEAAYQRFQRLADETRVVSDEQLSRLAHEN
jgi:2-isopropylmalate synthase